MNYRNGFSHWPDALSHNGHSNSLSFDASYYFESNAITNNLVRSYYLKRFIDEGDKEDVSKNLDGTNRAGLGFNAGLTYSHADTVLWLPNSFYSVSLRNRYHINCRFM